MKFVAKLNLKFYIVMVLLFGITVLGWYGLFFLNANQILMEDNTPMDSQTKILFSVVIGFAVLSWTFSLFAILKQMFVGYAFSIDESGINRTLTAINIFAFIFVVPIKNIPFDAIEKVSKEDGTLTINIDKSKIEVSSIFRIFARKKYHFFAGFTEAKQEEIQKQLKNIRLS